MCRRGVGFSGLTKSTSFPRPQALPLAAKGNFETFAATAVHESLFAMRKDAGIRFEVDDD